MTIHPRRQAPGASGARPGFQSLAIPAASEEQKP